MLPIKSLPLLFIGGMFAWFAVPRSANARNDSRNHMPKCLECCAAEQERCLKRRGSPLSRCLAQAETELYKAARGGKI